MFEAGLHNEVFNKYLLGSEFLENRKELKSSTKSFKVFKIYLNHTGCSLSIVNYLFNDRLLTYKSLYSLIKL